MKKGIIYRISLPNEIYRTDTAPKIVVPGIKGDLSVLVARAPTSVLLRNGMVRILDEADKVTGRYFVKGGIADIARNRCAVSTEEVTAFDDITAEQAAAKRDAAACERDKASYPACRLFGISEEDRFQEDE